MLMEPALNLAEPPHAGVLPAVGPRFEVHRDASCARAEAQHFIQRIYGVHYDATVRSWAPVLVTLVEDGEIQAAAGYRVAAAPLFLERYLQRPVEAVIAQHAGKCVARASIVEVGHFSSARPGAGRRLMALLGRHLAAQGHAWAVSTTTEELRLIFRRLRMRTVELGRADPAMLGDAAADWGSYYAHAPLVMAGEIRSNLGCFAPVPLP
jgi:hypothetical protein